MVADSLVTARVTSEKKERFAAAARDHALSESGLKRLVIGAVGTVQANDARVLAVEPIGPRVPTSSRRRYERSP